MDYNFKAIEEKWQLKWKSENLYKVSIDKNKPKYYILDMFPYPSGAGLHVGHPLGYIASDIYARYKLHKGFNVLHPMGYDAFGLPAEQYAIQTGTHPAITTEKNINRYREQLDKLGFCYDWDREIRTCDPNYYKWTQWTFIKLFNSWYNYKTNRAEDINALIKLFETEGNTNINAANTSVSNFTAEQWKEYSEKEKQVKLMSYRLAYIADTMVNWCPELGTVLANDEVSEGLSVRGGHVVERKTMKQWLLRISAYNERLLQDLDKLDWSDSLKEIQRNWIGKSNGCNVNFKVKGSDINIEVFTTRADTIFGVSFMVLAPEHPLVSQLTKNQQYKDIDEYIKWSKNRTERDRISEIKKTTGSFTGSYAINPLNNEDIPIYIADYVLMGYGSGAIMGVPAHDSRDFLFAKHFKLPIRQVVIKQNDNISDTDLWETSYDSKEGYLINSGFINGLSVNEAITKCIKKIEELNLGQGVVNYRLRDAIFSRQRYWGEPFPIYYKEEMPYTLSEAELPLELPEISKYLPTEQGEPPLARAENWTNKDGFLLETNTMPGFAGSSGYYLRYMDTKNKNEYFAKEAVEYWQNVDLYIGGAEHATGHLIYARFWNKFLFDLGLSICEEPFKKLINQGMIQGRSNFVYRVIGENKFVSFNIKNNYKTQPIHVDINIVKNDILNIEEFKKWQPQFKNAEFILEDNKYICGWEVEKMSKSKFNVQNPDDLIEKYGADTLRIYEMFLGPLEQSKPWDTNGIEGVYRFLRKFWRLFFDSNNNFIVNDIAPSAKELKILHTTINKVENNIERFSFNTAVSAFMICVNELSDINCNNKLVLSELTVLLSPFAPHICEEIWNMLGNKSSILKVQYPIFNSEYIKENNVIYPVSFNGKMRFKIEMPINSENSVIEKAVLSSSETTKWLEGKQPKKIIIVPNKIINIVI